MTSVPEAVEKIIRRSRYLSEAFSKEIINTSALARYIKPEVEEILLKKVSQPSIIMAIRRVSVNKKTQPKYRKIMSYPPEMIVRSNLRAIYIQNSLEISDILSKIIKYNNGNYFINVAQGITETTIIASNNLYGEIKSLLKSQKIISEFSNLSGITVRLSKEAITTPGIYYFFLKSIAWEEINLQEIISSYQELTLVFKDEDINRAFSILKSLFSTKLI